MKYLYCLVMGMSFLTCNAFVAPINYLKSFKKVPLSRLHVVAPTISFLVANEVESISSAQVLEDISNNEVEGLLLNERLNEVSLLEKDQSVYRLHTHPIISSKIVETALEHHVPIEYRESPAFLQNVGGFLQSVFMISLLFVVLNGLRTGVGIGTGRMPSMPNLFPGKYVTDSDATFEDWAGSPEVLRECTEVVSFLTDREKYQQIGGTIPRGILLEGPPGTGKTLLAKAIAGEADAQFISMSGSEFVELFVGMGASRVRQLFAEARRNKPCILFIDEIDAVGRQRGAGVNLGNDEREQTLNQLLAEMDGFQNNDDIIVIAATNRRDVLDVALLRPGRFDRIINVPLPDTSSRKKILQVHANTKVLDANIDLDQLAIQTAGFSGAELQNLLNEAALIAVRSNLSSIDDASLMDAQEKLMVGIKKEIDHRPLETKRRVAIHEAGHAVLCLHYPEYFDFVKVTIQNTYSGAGGYTIYNDKPDMVENGLYTRDYLKKRLRILLGGRAAESLYYGDDFISVGATEDLRQVNQLARRMINQFGMGEQIENYYNQHANDENPFLGRTMGSGHQLSEDLASAIDKEVLFLVKEAYQETKKILKEKETLVNQIVSGLLEKTTLLPSDVL